MIKAFTKVDDPWRTAQPPQWPQPPLPAPVPAEPSSAAPPPVPPQATVSADARSTAIDVLYVVVLLQGGMAVAAAIAALLGAAAFGFVTAPVALATVGAAGVTLLLARGIRNRSRRARRLLIWAEITVIVFAIVDLLLALFLADRGLGLVGTTTRLIIPFLVIRWLRKPAARLEFGLPLKVPKQRWWRRR